MEKYRGNWGEEGEKGRGGERSRGETRKKDGFDEDSNSIC